MNHYEVISSSSEGNAVIYHNIILVDVGVSFKQLEDKLIHIKYILLTHIHYDHFNKSAINKIGQEFPNIILCIPDYLVEEVKKLNYKGNTFVVSKNKKYKFENMTIETFELFHDVPNIGYKIIKDRYKIVHATDTNYIDHIQAKDYDLYAIEHNYDEEILHEQIAKKIQDGIFAYEIRSKDSHLSFQKAYDWISKQKKEDSEILMLHISPSYLKK
jgi:phosphoribosyl 1,2-cyclic phosphodiesterase